METMVESVMIHGSYLLMNKTIAAGSTRQLYQLFLKKSENFNEKLKFLENIYKGHSGFEDAQRAIKIFKDFKKIKHPSASLIITHKKFQKALEAEYENQTKSVISTMDEQRLISMDELTPHGYFDWYHIDDDLMRVPGEKHVSVQNILQFLPEEFAGQPFLFILPVSLFKEASRFDETYYYDAALPPFMENLSFLHTCFELPNVLLLSHSELHTVKMQVQDSFHPFNKTMDRWLKRCTENNNTSSGIEFFKSEVLPAAESFQKTLQENSILNQHSRVGNDKQKICFSLGEICMSEVWRLLFEREMIPGDGVWNEMTALMEESRYQQRRPVLFFSVVYDEEEEADADIPFKKKSLSID
jgi:hypothetical protein